MFTGTATTTSQTVLASSFATPYTSWVAIYNRGAGAIHFSTEWVDATTSNLVVEAGKIVTIPFVKLPDIRIIAASGTSDFTIQGL